MRSGPLRPRRGRAEVLGLAAGLALIAGGCRDPNEPDEPKQATSAGTSALGSPGTDASPGSRSPGSAPADQPRADPFAGVEALRPLPWTGWPLENVDLETEAGWRIDPVSGGFALERGLLLAAEPGDFVLAIAPGEVVEVVELREIAEPSGAVELVLAHGEGIESRYGPLAGALVHAGLPVERGAAIGLVEGRSLRLELRVDGIAIDPLLALRQPLHRWPALIREHTPAPG